MSRLVTLVLACLVAGGPLLTALPPAAAQEATRGGPRRLASGRLPVAVAGVSAAGVDAVSAADRYIVVLRDDVADPLAVANRFAAADGGLAPTHVYRHLFKGFAARIPAAAVAALRRSPLVAEVVPDRVFRAVGEVPTGVDRIDADRNATARINGRDTPLDVDVAVVDSGVDLDHRDLNVWAYANCTDSGVDEDDNGHGTHVAGTIGARDNGRGVVGIAPGARIWSIRVLRQDPSEGTAVGRESWIICGLELVARYATNQRDVLGTIEVANTSLGGGGNDSSCPTRRDPFHQAFCDVVDAGITMVVAAGNEAKNAANFVPATYEEVITVSALADSDGAPHGRGRRTFAGPDDTFATFSNFGADVDIAAPGVDIKSTWLRGGYNTISGTSMASPLVAGAAALLLARDSRLGPVGVKRALLADRERFDMPNDPDAVAEGILNVNDDGPPDPRTRSGTTRPASRS